MSHKTNGYFLIKSFWYYGKSLIFGNCQLLIIYCFKDSSILLQDIEIHFTLFNVCDLFYNKNIYILLLCFFQFDKYKIHLIECKGWQAKTGKNKSVLDVKNKTHLFSKSSFISCCHLYVLQLIPDYISTFQFEPMHSVKWRAERIRGYRNITSLEKNLESLWVSFNKIFVAGFNKIIVLL